jgi:RHS repeat-associated protein
LATQVGGIQTNVLVVTYDNAGNITVDSRFRNLAFQYDANNRQKQSSATDGSGAVVSVYDAGGQRVATQVSGSLTNVLVYDAGGKLVAEYGSAPTESSGTQFVTSDAQGSPRAITSASGTVISRHDYAPFGEDLPSGIGMRAPGQNYSQPDAVRQKYAGMENDDASGMAHTLWRQYDNLSARWTAPDPYGGSMSIASPQSFNRYSYVENDPVNQVDPLGLALADIGVVQTDSVAEAQMLERRIFQIDANARYAAAHGGTVSYEGNRAFFTPAAASLGAASLGGAAAGVSNSATASVNVVGGDGIGGSQNSSGLVLPTDPNHLAMLDVLLGEASSPGNPSWGMDDYGEGAYRRPRGRLAEWEVEGEMKYMIFTIDNRLHDWTQYGFKGWKDVIEQDSKQFLGYKKGGNIAKLANDPALVEKARMAIQAINDYRAQPLRNVPGLTRFYYWKAIVQDNDGDKQYAIMKRGRATRMANTDFMVSENRY